MAENVPPDTVRVTLSPGYVIPARLVEIYGQELIDKLNGVHTFRLASPMVVHTVSGWVPVNRPGAIEAGVAYAERVATNRILLRATRDGLPVAMFFKPPDDGSMPEPDPLGGLGGQPSDTEEMGRG